MGEEGGKESEEREKVLYSYELKIAWYTIYLWLRAICANV